MKKKNYNVILGLILFGGAVLRLLGVQYGLPGIYNSDESLHLLNVLYMGATRNLEPLYFLYPTAFHIFLLPFYAAYFLIGLAVGIFQSSADMAASYAINPTGLFLLGRTISAVFGVATAYIVWLVGKRWFAVYGKTEKHHNDKDFCFGSWAALLLMLSFLHAERSHWLLLETPLAFACTWALYWILKASDSGLKRQAIFAGLITGLAISVKYNAGFLVLPLVVGFLLRIDRKNWKAKVTLVFLTGIACITGFLIGTPSVIWAAHKYLDVFHYQRAVMHTGWIGKSSQAGMLWPVVELVKSDTSVGVILIFATLVSIFRKNRASMLLLLFVIPTLLYVSTFKTTFVRYLIPVIPAMAVLGGYALSTIIENFSRKWVIILIGLALLWPLGKIVLLDIRLFHQDTRRAAEMWFEQNVESGKNVAYENYVYGPNLFDPERVLRNMPGDSNSIALELAKRLEAEKGRRSWYCLINFRETLAEPLFPDSLDEETLKNYSRDPYLREVYSSRYQSLDELKKASVEYIVISSDNYFRYFNNTVPDSSPLRPYFNQVRQFYRSVIRQQSTRLVAEFAPTFWNMGPTIKIYSFK